MFSIIVAVLFAISFFLFHFYILHNTSQKLQKKLQVKIEKVAKSCNIKFLETAQNTELHIF